MPNYPRPVLDLSSNGFVACLAAAGLGHVGNYSPEDRPRIRPERKHLAWAACEGAQCLYCRAAGPSGGEEHILSVALGNWFWTLPPNVACERCNNGVLSMLDTALQKHPLIASVWTLANVRGRSGQAPQVGASNMRLARDASGSLRVEADRARDVTQGADELILRPTWVNQGPRQKRDTARALLKSALGMVWLARGPDESQRAKYDHVRHAIHGDTAVPLKYGFGNSSLPSHAIQILVISHEELCGLRVSLDYLGIQLWAETDGGPDEAALDFVREAV
jgi:hypothetical protein